MQIHFYTGFSTGLSTPGFQDCCCRYKFILKMLVFLFPRKVSGQIMLFSGKIWACKNSAVFTQVMIFQENGVYFANIVEGLTCEFPDLGL